MRPYDKALERFASEVEKLPGVLSVAVIDGLGYPVLRPVFDPDHIFWENDHEGFTISGEKIQVHPINGEWAWSLNYHLNKWLYATRELCVEVVEGHIRGRGSDD